jgi:hypothetical protein
METSARGRSVLPICAELPNFPRVMGKLSRGISNLFGAPALLSDQFPLRDPTDHCRYADKGYEDYHWI